MAEKKYDEGLRWPPFDILHTTTNQKQAGVREGGSGGRLGATDYYDAETGAAGVPPGGVRSAGAAAALSGSAGGGADAPPLARNPVAYGPEQAMMSLKYRLGPNHSVVERVLSEVRSMLWGAGGAGAPPSGRGGSWTSGPGWDRPGRRRWTCSG